MRLSSRRRGALAAPMAKTRPRPIHPLVGPRREGPPLKGHDFRRMESDQSRRPDRFRVTGSPCTAINCFTALHLSCRREGQEHDGRAMGSRANARSENSIQLGSCHSILPSLLEITRQA